MCRSFSADRPNHYPLARVPRPVRPLSSIIRSQRVTSLASYSAHRQHRSSWIVVASDQMNLQNQFVDAVDRLGIDPNSESHLLHIAQDLVEERLPSGWEASETTIDDGGVHVFYYNHDTEESTWDHPLLEVYFAKVEDARNKTNAEQTEPKNEAVQVEIVDLGEIAGPIVAAEVDVMEPVHEISQSIEEPTPSIAKEVGPNTAPDTASDTSEIYSDDEFSDAAGEEDILALFDDDRIPPTTTSPPLNHGEDSTSPSSSPPLLRHDNTLHGPSVTAAADRLYSKLMVASQSTQTDAAEPPTSIPRNIAETNILRDEVIESKRARDKADFELKVATLHHSEVIEDMNRELDIVRNDADERVQALQDKCAVLEQDKAVALNRIKQLEEELHQERTKNQIRRSFLCDAEAQADMIEECQDPSPNDNNKDAGRGDAAFVELEEANRLLAIKIESLQKENESLKRQKQQDVQDIEAIAAAKRQIEEMRRQCRAIFL